MSKWRKPHGQYVRVTADWFIFEREAGTEFSSAVAGQYSSVSLYNNATDGSLLHVVGAMAVSSVNGVANAGNYISAFLFKGTWGTLQTNDTGRVIPGLGMLAGQFYINNSATFQTGTPVWQFGIGQFCQPWPYDYPMCLISPGYSLVTQGGVLNAELSVYLHWLVMGKAEGYY